MNNVNSIIYLGENETFAILLNDVYVFRANENVKSLFKKGMIVSIHKNYLHEMRESMVRIDSPFLMENQFVVYADIKKLLTLE